MNSSLYSRRAFGLLAANTAIATFAGGQLISLRPAFAQEAVTVRLGRFGSANPQSYAAATKSFQRAMKEAYDGELDTEDFVVQSGGQVVTAIAAGSLDVCNAGSSPIAVAYANGVKLTMPYVEKVITDSEALIVRKSEGIEKIEDLKGRKIGLPFNTSVHFAMLAALDSAGMDVTDVELLNMKPDQIVAAWTRGGIDAAYIWLPVQGTLLDSGGTTLVQTGELQSQGIIVFDGIVFRNEFLEQHPELVLAYLKEYAKITEIYRNEPKQVVETLSPFLALPEAKAAAYVKAFHSITPEEMAKKEWMGLPGDSDTGVFTALRKQSEFLHATGQINQVPDSFEALVDRTFLAKMVGA